MRKPLLLGLVCLLVALAAMTAAPAESNPTPADPIGGGNVMPPGNTGHLPAEDVVAGQSEHMTDQRDLYWDWGIKDWSFADPAELGAGHSPRDGVTIYRDEWGVPRIFGETDADAQFGVGYAMASDRMFQADIFRHVARGEMAQFLGGQEWFDYDREWRREFYTDDELLEMGDRFYTDEELGLVQAYLDGVNAYIAEALQDPSKLPVEYAALQIRPEPWELRHALAVFVLQSRDAVEGFGQELYNAALLADLRERLGEETARQVFDDVRFIRDPGSYTTVPREEGDFPYPGGGFEGFDADGVVLPDAPAQAQALAERDVLIARTLASVGLGRTMASNAIPVSGQLTESGAPILLGGPQLAYMVPGIFYEFEVRSPSQHARGIGFAGTAGVVLIGKTPTHAWSITYGYTDQVDVFLVPLDPEHPETHYLRDGASRALETHETTVTCRPYVPGLAGSDPAEAGCDGLPVGSETLTVRRVPEYGPVIGEVDVGGQPHAVVRVRGHWMREIQNGKPFMTFNQPATVEEFREAQRDFNIALTLNYVHADGDIAFWHVAAAPIRAQGTDVRLPTVGDGSHDWQGFVDFDEIPHTVNPAQGYTLNWNNQVSAGWHNGDSNSWAHLQRVDMLDRRMRALAARASITPDDIWQVNREAAFEDGRWHDFRPLLQGAFAGDQPSAALWGFPEVMAWDGQRTASQVDDQWVYDNPAVGIFDRFLLRLQRDVLAEPLGDFYASIGPDFAPAFYHLKSALLLRVLLGAEAPLPARHDWLGGRTPESAVQEAFTGAMEELTAEQEGDPHTWRFPAVLTTYQAVGLGSVEPHPFMNRGTYNQLAVVEPAPAQAVAPDPVEPARDLPATGGGIAAALLLLALATGATRRSR